MDSPYLDPAPPVRSRSTVSSGAFSLTRISQRVSQRVSQRMSRLSPRLVMSREVAPVQKLAEQTKKEFEEQYELLAQDMEEGGEFEMTWDENLYQFLHGKLFNSFVAVLIVVNAVTIGMETNDPDAQYLEDIEHVLMVLFLAELSARIAVFRWEFWDTSSSEFFWNLFDCLVVGLGMLDWFLSCIIHNHLSGGIGLTFLRSFRLSRLLRIFRLVRFAKRLYVLAYGFLLAVVAVGWVSFLMAVVLYICAIVLVRTFGHMEGDSPDAEFFRERFGTIQQAMFTLFQLAVQPDLTVYRHILFTRPFFCTFLIFFIVFGSFGMIALLTGVISEAMFEKNILKSEEARLERESMLKHIARNVANLFDEIPDHNDQGEVSVDQLTSVVPSVAKVFEQHGLAYTRHDLVCMVKLMDTDASGSINRSEFIRGILQMAEEVRPRLVMELHYDSVSYIKNRMDKYDAAMDRLILRQDELMRRVNARESEVLKKAVAEGLQEGLREAGSLQPSNSEIAGIGPSLNLNGNVGGGPPRLREGGITNQKALMSARLESVSEHASLPLGRALEAAAPAGGGDVRGAVASLRNDVRTLEGSLFAWVGRMEAIITEAQTEQRSKRAGETAFHRSCMESVAGVAQRVGECDFSAKQACRGIVNLAGLTHELDAKLRQLLEGRGQTFSGSGCSEGGGGGRRSDGSTGCPDDLTGRLTVSVLGAPAPGRTR